MSYHKLPLWADYWKGDDDLSVPFVSSTLTLNRFAQILANLHINGIASVPKNNQDKQYTKVKLVQIHQLLMIMMMVLVDLVNKLSKL